MGWIASLHGDVSHLSEDAARDAENAVRDALQKVADGLVDAGHVGVAATFHGSATGDHNLLQPDAPTDPGPPVTGTPDLSPPVEAPTPQGASDQEQDQAPAAGQTPPPGESADPGTAATATS